MIWILMSYQQILENTLIKDIRCRTHILISSVSQGSPLLVFECVLIVLMIDLVKNIKDQYGPIRIALSVFLGIIYTYAYKQKHILPMRELILNMPFEIILLCIPWVLCTAGSTFMDFCSHPDSRHSFPARDNIMLYTYCTILYYAILYYALLYSKKSVPTSLLTYILTYIFISSLTKLSSIRLQSLSA